MKIGSATENTLITNTGSTNKFKIEATGKAFQILSSALYSHKVKAVVREIGCNAADAHIDAGTTDIPFEVSLPCKEDSHFKVRDFGVGLAEDKFVEVYTTYFGSSKSNSNDHTGGLGLGSKTPFIMSKSFTVHSYYNGTEFIWHSFVNDNGQPDVVLLTSRDTTERNGLLVIVPIGQGLSDTEKNALYREFADEAKTIYQWFTTVPNVQVNNKPFEIKKRLDASNATYTQLNIKGVEATVFYNTEQKVEGQADTIWVKMGNVVYPYKLTEVKGLDRFGGNIVHTEAIIKYLTSTGRLNSGKTPLIVDVGVGGVDVAPSREALSLTNSTELTIINIIIRFMELFCKQVQDSIDNAQSTYDKYQALYLVPPVKGKLFTINGKEIDPSRQKAHWTFDTDVGIAKKGHNCLRSFSIDQFAVKLRRAGARGILPVKNEVSMVMYGPEQRSRMVILVDTTYKGELRNWVNANAKPEAAVVVVFGGGLNNQRPLTDDEMKPFLEDKHPQVVKFSQLVHKPVIAPRVSNVVTTKVTNETALILHKVDTGYNYFTSGNASQSVVLADIVKNYQTSGVFIPYIIFRKKGDTVQTHLNDAVTKTPTLADIGKWSRTNSLSSTWREDASFLSAICVTIPNELGALAYHIDPTNKIDIGTKYITPSQLVLTPTAYDEVVQDKATYPMFFTVDRWINEVVIPSMPATSERIEITDDNLTGGVALRDSNVQSMFRDLGLTQLLDTFNELRIKSNVTLNQHITHFNRTTTTVNHGYNLGSKSVTRTYGLNEHELVSGIRAAAKAVDGPAGAKQLDIIINRLVNAGGIGRVFFTNNGYRASITEATKFAIWSMVETLRISGYDSAAMDQFLTKHLHDNAVLS